MQKEARWCKTMVKKVPAGFDVCEELETALAMSRGGRNPFGGLGHLVKAKQREPHGRY